MALCTSTSWYIILISLATFFIICLCCVVFETHRIYIYIYIQFGMSCGSWEIQQTIWLVNFHNFFLHSPLSPLINPTWTLANVVCIGKLLLSTTKQMKRIMFFFFSFILFGFKVHTEEKKNIQILNFKTSASVYLQRYAICYHYIVSEHQKELHEHGMS